MRSAAFLVLLLLLPIAAASPLLLPQQGDPDVPSAGAPVASVQVFLDEKWHFTEGSRTRDMLVPDVPWDRVVLTWESRQVNEPWDRRFGIAIDGVEVLRGTTPRAPMTLTKDVTEFASLLPPGATVPIQMHLGSWVDGHILASARFDFYLEGALAPARRDAVRPIALWSSMVGGAIAGADVDFGPAAPSRATIHFVTSGHGQEGEFWWMETPPAVATFRILVDGEEIAHATAMPYVYALIGLGGSQSVVSDAIHTGVWWSGFRAADLAGVHAGVGEIPAYRAEIDASQLGLLTGTRRVEVVQDTGAGSWVTSAAILVDACDQP